MNLNDYLDYIYDFPKEGIKFCDISPILADPDAWQIALSRMTRIVRKFDPDLLVGVESRGFLLAAPLASRLGSGFTMARKAGKLPGDVISHEYDLEYSKSTLEIRTSFIKEGQKVVICDDLLATGGTMVAAAELVRKLGAEVVGAICMVELDYLGGAKKLEDHGISFRSLLVSSL